MKVPQPPPRHVRAPAPHEQAFHFRNGATAASLAEFAQRLRHEPAALIHHHHEHYAPWIRHVLADDPLARRFEHFASMGDAASYRDVVAALVEARLTELAVT